MDEKVQEFLIAVEASGLSNKDLRELKKNVGASLTGMIKNNTKNPAARKQDRLQKKLAAIQAQIAELKTPAPTPVVEENTDQEGGS